MSRGLGLGSYVTSEITQALDVKETPEDVLGSYVTSEITQALILAVAFWATLGSYVTSEITQANWRIAE